MQFDFKVNDLMNSIALLTLFLPGHSISQTYLVWSLLPMVHYEGMAAIFGGL